MEHSTTALSAGLALKSLNRNLIYNMLWREGRASKQDIVRRLKLSLPTVTNNLDDLCAEGLVVENGSFGNTGGRSAKGYSIEPTAYMAVGVDINKTHVSVVVVDLLGNLVQSVHEHRHHENSAAYYAGVGALTSSVVQGLPITEQQILGVGISTQGLISADRRRVIYGPILNNTNATVEEIAKNIPYKCELFHDSESAAFAERWVSPELENGVYLSLSTNLGGAIIINRDIFLSGGAIAGKPEHTTLYPHGELCYCGNRGCAEAYLNTMFLTRGMDDGKLEPFFKRLEENDAEVTQRWKEYLDNLAILVNSIYMLMDTNVILGGYLAPYMEKHVDQLKEIAYAYNKISPADDYIRVGRFKTEAVAAGAALRYINRFLQEV